MRTPEQIVADILTATQRNDAAALLLLADEIDVTDSPEIQAVVNNTRGWALYLKGRIPEAFQHLLRAAELGESLNQRRQVAGVWANLGLILQRTGDLPAALEYLHRAMSVFIEFGERRQVADTTNNIGITYFTGGDYPAALEQWQKACEIYEELDHAPDMAGVVCNIGNVYAVTGDNDRALDYYQRALAMHRDAGNVLHAGHDLSNIGDVYQSVEEFDLALKHHKSAWSLYEELSSQHNIVRIMGAVMGDLVAMGSDAEAEQILRSLDDLQIDEPEVWIKREHDRAVLQERASDLTSAALTLQGAVAEAGRCGLRKLEAEFVTWPSSRTT
jgi:tetratricopeptide (TPR) repeat protein